MFNRSKMANLYESKTVKQLKDILRSRGLDHRAKRKADLIKLLTEDDKLESAVYTEINVVENEDISDNDDEEIQFGNKLVDTDMNLSEESDKVKALRLELEIAKVNLQREQLNPAKTAVIQSSVNCFSGLSGIKAKLPVMSANCDVISFFAGLEKVLQVNGVTEDAWSKLLPTTLNERCLKVYSKLSVTDCSDYNVIKAAIFESCKVNAHSYLQELMSACRTGKETYNEYVNRLIELQSNYLQCQRIEDFESLKNDNLMVIFFRNLKPEVASFVKSKEPRSLFECARLADLLYTIEVESKGIKQSHTGFKKPYDPSKSSWQKANSDMQNNGKRGNEVAIPASNPVSNPPRFNPSGDKSNQIVCYLCKMTGHRKAQCPKSQSSKQQTSAFVTEFSDVGKCKFLVPIFLGTNRQPLVSYRDSGSCLTIVQTPFVNKACYTGQMKRIEVVGGQLIDGRN